MEKKRKDTGILPISIVVILFIVFMIYMAKKEKKDSIEVMHTTQSLANEEYQVFEEFQFKVKCPAILNDVSSNSSDDFDFNYAGSTDETFYQIMIVRIPAGRFDLTREEEKEFLIKMFAAKGGGKSVLWGDDNYPAYLLDDYTQEGYKGRGIAVAREGYIYTFNVITKSDLDATFNSFTNNVKFINNTKVNGDKDSFQTFPSAGFKIKCDYTLYTNTTFLDRAKEQGFNNVVGAYMYVENEEEPKITCIVNINVYDHSEEYKNLPADYYDSFEEECLEKYAQNLGSVDIRYNRIAYQGVNALEYSFKQAGLPPAKAIMFYKSKRSYLLQMSTNIDLETKFNELKSNFILIN